jgi:hydrogenase maturation factor
MVMAVKPGCEEKLIQHLESRSIPATIVGEMTEDLSVQTIIEGDEEKEFLFDGNDPYWAAFFKAMKAGWK